MVEKNVELVKKFYAIVDSGNPEELVTLFSPEAKIFYESSDPVSFPDMIPLIKMFYTSFPDYKHIIDDIFAVEDKVVARLSFTGTFTNNFMGFVPNGLSFSYVGVHIFQVSDGKFMTVWAVEDELGMMTKLGIELKQK